MCSGARFTRELGAEYRPWTASPENAGAVVARHNSLDDEAEREGAGEGEGSAGVEEEAQQYICIAKAGITADMDPGPEPELLGIVEEGEVARVRA